MYLLFILLLLLDTDSSLRNYEQEIKNNYFNSYFKMFVE